MKVLMLLGEVPVKYGGINAGGAAKVAWYVSKQLVNNGVEVFLYPLHDYSAEVIEGVEIIGRNKPLVIIKNWPVVSCVKQYVKSLKEYGFPQKYALRFGLSNCIQEKYIQKVIRRIKPDIIHIHGISADRLFAIKMALRKKQIPLIVTLHGLIGFSPDTIATTVPPMIEKRKKYEGKLLKKIIEDHPISVITSVSSRITKKVVEAYGIPKNRIATVLNGVSEEFSHPTSIDKAFLRDKLELPQGKKILLTVGTLSKRKNQILVLKSLSELPENIKKRITYVLVGDGPERKMLEDFAQKNGLKNMVIFKGKVFGQDLVDTYWASDYFILTSTSEALPLVFLEAMAAGLPVLTIESLEGVDDIFTGEAFILSKDYKPKSIALAIKEMLNKEWFREAIVEHVKSFSWDEIGKRYLEIYEDILWRT